jgi:histidyl-tRNA synthetase
MLPLEMFIDCTEGTENRMFEISESVVLTPEVTNYVRAMGMGKLGTDKVYYVAKCFRNEANTGPERLCEFTQIGVELLGGNSLDCRKVVRKDAIRLFKKLLPSNLWRLDDDVERGLNLYDDTGKTFEISSCNTKKQLLGGGPYGGGAGWALGLERLMLVMA